MHKFVKVTILLFDSWNLLMTLYFILRIFHLQAENDREKDEVRFRLQISLQITEY